MLLQHVRYFKQIAASGSIAAAAAALRLPASSLSRAMAQFQKDVGQRLFERSGRSIVLTPQGVAYLKRAELALHELDAARSDAERASGVSTLALGFIRALGPHLTPRMVKAFGKVHNNVSYRLVEGHADTLLMQHLLQYDIDLALAFTQDLDERFSSRLLKSVEFELLVPRGHRFARRKSVSLSDCADESFIILKPSCGTRIATDKIFASASFVPRVFCEVDEIDTLRGFVGIGLGVGLVPSFVRRYETETPRLRLCDEHRSADMMLIWSRDLELSATAHQFSQFITANAQSIFDSD